MASFPTAIATLGIIALSGLNLIFSTKPAFSQSHQGHSMPMTWPVDKVPNLTPRERSAERLINQALEKMHQSDYPEALADFNQALTLNPNHYLAYVNRGDLRRKLGDNQGAVEDYTQAIRTNPNFSYIYNSRGNAREALGDYEGAIADYTKAIALYPEDGIGYSNRGAAQHHLGNEPAAMEDLNEAIQYNPGYAQAYTNRGKLFIALENIPEAIANYQQAAKLYAEQGDNGGYLQAILLLKQAQN